MPPSVAAALEVREEFLRAVSKRPLVQSIERKNMPSIVTSWSEKPADRLVDSYPDEIDYFQRRFVWPYQNGGFYIRTAYERVLGLPKWRPFKVRGEWQRLHPALVNDLVEKHLDFDRFCRTWPKWLRARDETAFWFGMMAGKFTYNDCIDIDSHKIVGWNSAPTRWHPTAMGEILPGPISWRSVPVVMPSLRFFQIAKLVYDNFPNRIWAFSSANLGLAVWKTHATKQPTEVVHRRCTTLFKRVGLPAKMEHYPCPPKSRNTFGGCHRRPCGMDSGIITENGVVVDSIEQIRCFMRPPSTPSFETIVDACFQQLFQMYREFRRSGKSVCHGRLRKSERQEIVDECLGVVREIKTWCRAGCPIDHELIAGCEAKDVPDEVVEPIVAADPAVPAVVDVGEATYPDCFWNADLEQVNRSGQWIPFVKFLVENGFPCDDCFRHVISTLAKWFVFVELFGEDRSRIEHVLQQYIAKKHNGKVTRWLTGEKRDVLQQICRIVDDVIQSELDEGKRVFAEIRQRRESGQYAKAYFFEAHILEDHSSSSFDSLLPSHLLRGGLRDAEFTEGKWKYVPDNTPLPEQLQQDILNLFRKSGRPLRKRNGQYPTLNAITRFFNYLVSGRKSGHRRASQKLLHEMGFPGKTKERQAVISVLLKAKLLHSGDYRSRQRSRLWILDNRVLSLMNNHLLPSSQGDNQ